VTDPDKQIVKYADESMFKAQKTEALTPRVTLIHANNDPLGQLAQLGMMYQGKSVRSLAKVTDADRRYYFEDGRKNILGMPSEAIMFHFLIENVTRSFTHQLVRTRQASYAQESLRFAVKEDFPVALPPSLVGTYSRAEWRAQQDWVPLQEDMREKDWLHTEEKFATDTQRMRFQWEDEIAGLEKTYMALIERGMPAEDARGLLPHNILTKINMVISLRSLMNMAGQRLCTQAQFEHRMVWAEILKAIRVYGRGVVYDHHVPGWNSDGDRGTMNSPSDWQFNSIAAKFQPICYQTGKCQFESDFDRYCNIRDRVQTNAQIGRPSEQWYVQTEGDGGEVLIPAIHPKEWLRPDAAIQPDGSWRSTEAQENIKDRRL
jgi:flavin-dependent thymidylate synthase